MSRFLYRLGRSTARRPGRAIGAWLLAAVLVIVGSATFGRTLRESNEVPGLDSQQALDLLTAAQSDRAGLTAQIVVTPVGEAATFTHSARARSALTDLRASVAGLPNVIAVGELISPDGRVALLPVQYPVLEELTAHDLENLKEVRAELAPEAPIRVEMNGDLFFNFEQPETGVGEMIGIVAAVVILLVAFGSLVAMGLPIGMALFGLALGISSFSLITYLIEIPSFTADLATMIGLGVGIDYALFLVTRHREFLARGLPIEEAAGRAVATAGQAVIFAGGTVMLAILGLAVAGVPFMTGSAVGTSVMVAIMVIASISLLPAFLGLAGPWINRLGLPLGPRRPDGLVSERWQRWGAHVAANAWRYAVGVTVGLLALTAPVLDLQLGTPDDGTKPESRTERQAYDLAAAGFGAGFNGPLLIAVDLADEPVGESAAAGAGGGVVARLAQAIEHDFGIASVAPPEVNAEAGVATIMAFPHTGPQDGATLDTVERLRSEVFPTLLDDSSATAYIGGQTASFADIGNKVNDRLPWFMGAVIGLSFLLLMVVFRSVLVPLKAALLNLLSIGAAYGVLVMVFQWEWGASLIGVESAVPIIPFLPMFMFAILFGLSMDYEVFLLSRVREEYVRTGDNDASVVHGIATTARVISSAALIMISVFGGFVLGSDPIMKMFGLGLATAILVDATVVRLVLVPATMKLMGDANWWLPGWLDRLLPTIDFESDAALDPVVMPSETVIVAGADERQPTLV